MMKPSSNPQHLDWTSGCFWGVLGFMGMAVLMILLMVFLPGWTRSGSEAVVEPQMTVLPVVRLASTAGGNQSPEQAGSPQQVQGEIDATPSMDIVIGQLVQIHGTGGIGLRLRNAPSLEAEINLVAPENEIYEVRNGPSEADGYRWWYLINPYDEDLEGWAVEQYLHNLTEN